MTTITLNSAGIKFSSAFTTVVTKVIDGDKGSSIVLDSMPHTEISLDGKSAKEVGIEINREVTIKPVAGEGTSFTLTVGKIARAKSPTPAPVRGNGCARSMEFSNELR